MSHSYDGGCHCGAIGFRFATAIAPAHWSIRACQCSFCRAHDALSTSDPAGHISFSAAEQAHLQRYRFGLRTADFLLCRQCGVYIGAVILIGERHYAIVNTHALATQPDDIAQTAPIEYDGEDIDGRVSRREERWTPCTLDH